MNLRMLEISDSNPPCTCITYHLTSTLVIHVHLSRPFTHYILNLLSQSFTFTSSFFFLYHSKLWFNNLHEQRNTCTLKLANLIFLNEKINEEG